MRPTEVGRLRMRASGLTARRLDDALDVVRHHGAMQAQDYGPAKWSIGQRAGGLTDADVEDAVAAGAILRTHVLRPTWHFVAAEDARWLLELTGPRVRQATAGRFRELGLDRKTLARSEAAVAATLAKGTQLTRREIARVLDDSGVDRTGQRLPHILMHLELEGVVCSGARRGSDHTYALLDERVPPARPLDRDDALTELTRRYLTSHGPATVQDLRWWASLKASDVARGLDLLSDEAVSERVDGEVLWSIDADVARPRPTTKPHLLQVYDELVVGYTRSRFFGDLQRSAVLGAWRDRSLPGNVILVDGHVAGHWKRTLDKDEVRVEVWPRAELDARGRRGLERAAADLGRFLGRRVMLGTHGAV
ncbi:MAG TPA: winged helix DNA-binding domain-containing protein [Actinomycetota bacterium]|nr:winged helix DNA-binding domain-containing protein [Actinomycetota bacterium]